MTFDVQEFKQKYLVTEMFATGSRVICNPPVLDTDEDYILLVVNRSQFVTRLNEDGWQFSMDGDDYGGDFVSLFNEDKVNLIITDDVEFYSRSLQASIFATRLNLLNKTDRIDLFELARYGRLQSL